MRDRRARVHAARRRASLRHAAKRTSSTAARWFAQRRPRCRCIARASTSRRRAPPRTRRSINLHLATGQIGKPGAGPFQPDRPAECHGRPRSRRHGEPAVRRIAISPNAAHRAEVARFWGVAALPRSARQDRGRAVRRARATARSRWCGSRARIPRSRCRTRRRCARRSSAPSSSSLQEAFADDRDRAVRRHRCCPRRRGARRKARSRIPSGASRACARRCVRPARRAPTGRSPPISRARLEARLRPARPTLVPVRDRPKRVFDEHRATTRGRDLDIGGLTTRCSIATGRSSGRFRRAHARQRAPVHGRPVRDAERARAVRAGDYVPPAQKLDAGIRSADDRPPARPVARDEPHRHGAALVCSRARAARPALRRLM